MNPQRFLAQVCEWIGCLRVMNERLPVRDRQVEVVGDALQEEPAPDVVEAVQPPVLEPHEEVVGGWDGAAVIADVHPAKREPHPLGHDLVCGTQNRVPRIPHLDDAGRTIQVGNALPETVVQEDGEASSIAVGHSSRNAFVDRPEPAVALEAADVLRTEGLDIGVVNARFVKPMDMEMVQKALTVSDSVVTAEEAMLMGGFGSALLEAANDLKLDASKVHRIGIPDAFVEHQSRPEVLAELKLDAEGIVETCRHAATNVRSNSQVTS